jgi:hypothetical protein
MESLKHYLDKLRAFNCSIYSSEQVFQTEVFWVVTPYSVVVGCQRFGGPCCPQLQGEDSIYGVTTQKTLT